MTRSHGPLFIKPRRRQIRLWAALAILNLIIGIAISLQPERITDLESVMRWGREWLAYGTDVYALPDVLVDYPPHAVVLLSPLSLLPLGAAVPIWVMVNLVFAFLAPYLAARCFQPHAPFRSILLPILMFVSWWGTHSLVQFSLLALTLSMAALLAADTRPLTSGVALGMALMKPQVALPVFFWTLFTRRWRVAATAVATIAAGCALYCARADAAPAAVIERYLANLRIYYAGDAIMTGASDLRPLIHVFVSNVSTLDMIAGGLALALLAGICAAGLQEGRWRTHTLYSAPPLVACWSLLTFYHLSYGFVVLLPVLMLLLFNDSEQTRLRKMLFWVMQVGLMIDVPGVARRAGLADVPMLGSALLNADRLLVLLIFVGLVTLAWRESATSPA